MICPDNTEYYVCKMKIWILESAGVSVVVKVQSAGSRGKGLGFHTFQKYMLPNRKDETYCWVHG